MSLEIQLAAPADAPALTQVFYATFVGDFNRTMFPITPDVTAWWERKFSEEARATQAGEGREVLLKVTGEDGAVVAFANWKCPASAADRDLQKHEPEDWAPSCNKELCEKFFSRMDAEHKERMGERPHYSLSMLGVHPSYQGRGLASKLLKWGLDRADAEGVEAYLSSSPEGKPVYEKYGFKSVYTFSPFPGYLQEVMIRPVTSQ